MSELLRLFAHNILPVLIAASAGYALHKLLHVEPRPLSRAAFYVLAPALVFDLMLSLEIPGREVLVMMAAAAGVIALTALISLLVGRALRLTPTMIAAFLLSTVFMNAGNYGLSLNLFVFGEMGLAWASIYFVGSVMLTNSLGIYIASRGRSGAIQSIRGLAKVPLLYAIAGALLLRALEVQLPLALARPIEILGLGAVPVMILVLGMQVASAGLPNRRALLAGSAALKLLLAPVLAALVVIPLGLQGLPRQVAIVESAMPTAVMSTIIAIEYDVESEFVTGAVLFSTLLSPLSLTAILALLRL